MSAPPTDKLAAIFARKRRELAARGPRVAEHPRPPGRDFALALTQRRPEWPVNVIAEVKRRSPDRKSTRLNSSHSGESRMPSSA